MSTSEWRERAYAVVTSDERKRVADLIAEKLEDGPGVMTAVALAAELNIDRRLVDRTIMQLRAAGLLGRKTVKYTVAGEGFRGHFYRLNLVTTGSSGVTTGGNKPNDHRPTADDHRPVQADSVSVTTGSPAADSLTLKNVGTQWSTDHVRQAEGVNLVHDEAMTDLARFEAKFGAVTGRGRADFIAALREDRRGVHELWREVVEQATSKPIGLLLTRIRAGEHRGKRPVVRCEWCGSPGASKYTFAGSTKRLCEMHWQQIRPTVEGGPSPSLLEVAVATVANAVVRLERKVDEAIEGNIVIRQALGVGPAPDVIPNDVIAEEA